jgi:prepilin-type processing-associated H-X9-DG protein
MDAPHAARPNALAWLALILGLLVPLTCGVTGPFALLFGFLALRRVDLSDGRLSGARAARAGVVLGAAGLVLFFGGLFLVGLYEMRGRSQVPLCANNLRRIGQAVNLYHEDKVNKHFPPGTVPEPDLPAEQRLSWMVAILPYMEATPKTGPAPPTKGEVLFSRFDLGKGWKDEKNLQAMSGAPLWYGCPAAPRPAPGEAALTQYVGIAGFGPDAPLLARTDPRAGFFGYDRIITRDDVKRGTVETMIVTERAGTLGPWAAGGPATVTGVDPEKQPYVPAQFGGLHPHGANTLFADGHATFIRDQAHPSIWQEQSRINVE